MRRLIDVARVRSTERTGKFEKSRRRGTRETDLDLSEFESEKVKEHRGAEEPKLVNACGKFVNIFRCLGIWIRLFS